MSNVNGVGRRTGSILSYFDPSTKVDPDMIRPHRVQRGLQQEDVSDAEKAKRTQQRSGFPVREKDSEKPTLNPDARMQKAFDAAAHTEEAGRAAQRLIGREDDQPRLDEVLRRSQSTGGGGSVTMGGDRGAQQARTQEKVDPFQAMEMFYAQAETAYQAHQSRLSSSTGQVVANSLQQGRGVAVNPDGSLQLPASTFSVTPLKIGEMVTWTISDTKNLIAPRDSGSTTESGRTQGAAPFQRSWDPIDSIGDEGRGGGHGGHEEQQSDHAQQSPGTVTAGQLADRTRSDQVRRDTPSFMLELHEDTVVSARQDSAPAQGRRPSARLEDAGDLFDSFLGRF